MNTQTYTDRIKKVSKGNHVTNQQRIVNMIKNLSVSRTPYAWTMVSATVKWMRLLSVIARTSC